MKPVESCSLGKNTEVPEFTDGPWGESLLHRSDEGVRLKDCGQRSTFTPNHLGLKLL